MQRRRQTPTAQDRKAPAGFEKIELAIEADAVAHAESGVKIQQVGAAAQQDVLAVIDDFGFRSLLSRSGIGRGAAAWKRPGFEDIDLESRAAERSRGGESGESAAGNENFGHHVFTIVTSGVACFPDRRRIGALVPKEVEPTAETQRRREPVLPFVFRGVSAVVAVDCYSSARMVSIVSASSGFLSRRQRAMRGKRTAMPERWRGDLRMPSNASSKTSSGLTAWTGPKRSTVLRRTNASTSRISSSLSPE